MPEALPGLGLLSEICIIHVHNVFVAGSLFHGDGVSQLVLDVHSIFHPANSLHFFRIKAALPLHLNVVLQSPGPRKLRMLCVDPLL